MKKKKRIVTFSPKKVSVPPPTKEQKRSLEILATIYKEWKAEFLSKPRTREEITSFVHRLKDRVIMQCGEEGLAGATVELIEHNIAEMFASNLTMKNRLVEFIGEKTNRKPFVIEFTKWEELSGCALVKRHMDAPNFVSLVLAGKGLIAEYEKDAVLVGYVENEIGLEPIKDYKSVFLAKNPVGEGQFRCPRCLGVFPMDETKVAAEIALAKEGPSLLVCEGCYTIMVGEQSNPEKN